MRAGEFGHLGRALGEGMNLVRGKCRNTNLSCGPKLSCTACTIGGAIPQ
jgi:hypothetical protein